VAAGIRSEAERLAQEETANNGQPIRESRTQVQTAAMLFEYYGGLAPSVTGSVPDIGSATLDFTRPQPYGVCAAVTPFNAPIFTMAGKVAPALAMGNAVIVKPSPYTPLTALSVARVAEEHGLPSGLLAVLPGRDAALGEAVVVHPRIPKISFTGSSGTGAAIARAAASQFKHLTLELGGKSASLILPDADLESAVSGSAYWTVFRSAGQICTHRTRVLAPKAVLDEVVERYIDVARGLATADPALDTTQVGPVISDRQRQNILATARAARDAGADVWEVETATSLPDRGYFVAPHVVARADEHSAIVREEIFGPVVSILGYDDDADAIRLANQSDYGLAATVWSRDTARAIQVADQLMAGNVSVNQAPVIYPWAPFRGWNHSGLGVEMGTEALTEYVRFKNFLVSLG
jgi:aldehyde dehydrogenase (NAD+)